MAQHDAALEAFDRLLIWKVSVWDRGSASAFKSTAASLERIKLEVRTLKSTKLLKAVLVDPQASKICALRWAYRGKEDVNYIIPLITNNCPELALLQVELQHLFALDFVSSVLEHSSSIKVLVLPWYTKGDIPRFFAALGQSQVSVLSIFSVSSSEFYQGLREYLAKDLLVRLKMWRQVPSEMMMLLADCTRLAELEMTQCQFSQPTVFANLSKSVTKLVLDTCKFADGVDWSFLVGSGVQELEFENVGGVNGNQLGGALAVRLRAKGLDKLSFWGCGFAIETLAVVGLEMGRIKRLETDRVSDASIELISLVLRSPSSEMKELKVRYNDNTASSIENHLVPALKHPNFNLTKLSFWDEEAEHKAAVKAVEDRFYHRLALFALLQGQQVRRVYCPLRRLPVEMFRMVGQVLI